MGDFTWVEKEPMQNFSKKVIGINYTCSKTEGEHTVYSGGAECFAIADFKPASYWTQTKIDEQAEAFRVRAGMDADMAAQLVELNK